MIHLVEKLSLLLTNEGYQSQVHQAGLELPLTDMDSIECPRIQLGPNTIEFFGSEVSPDIQTGFLQGKNGFLQAPFVPILNQVYYDPHTQDVWYRIVLIPIVSAVGCMTMSNMWYAQDMWECQPLKDLIAKIDPPPSAPLRPLAAVWNWASKFLTKEND